MPAPTQLISFPSGSHPLQAYLARPEGNGPFPGVVVIHEAFGLNDNIKGICNRFAGEGYAALGVNLFYGRNQVVCMFQFMGGMLFNSLEHQGIHDLKAGLDWLSGQPFVDGQRVGAVGYCMGGAFAIAWACTDNRLRAIAPYYGRSPRPLEAMRRLCPVVASYPDKDFTTPEGQKLAEFMAEHKIPHDVKIYPGTHHSFFNESRPAGYNADAAQDSWERVKEFFKEHIEEPHPRPLS